MAMGSLGTLGMQKQDIHHETIDYQLTEMYNIQKLSAYQAFWSHKRIHITSSGMALRD